MPVRLTWTPRTAADYQVIYRSEATFDLSSLPPELATLSASVDAYEDASPSSQVNYYAVKTVLGAREVLSELISVPQVEATAPPPPPPEKLPHRYWRVLGYSFGANGDGSAATIEFRAEVGGADQAGSGVADQSSFWSSSYNGEKCFDGDPSTLWAAAGSTGGGSWVSYDFGTPVVVLEVLLQARSGTWANQCFQEGEIQYSDDNTTWLSAIPIPLQSAWASSEIRVFS